MTTSKPCKSGNFMHENEFNFSKCSFKFWGWWVGCNILHLISPSRVKDALIGRKLESLLAIPVAISVFSCDLQMPLILILSRVQKAANLNNKNATPRPFSFSKFNPCSYNCSRIFFFSLVSSGYSPF